MRQLICEARERQASAAAILARARAPRRGLTNPPLSPSSFLHADGRDVRTPCQPAFLRVFSLPKTESTSIFSSSLLGLVAPKTSVRVAGAGLAVVTSAGTSV